MQRLIIDTDTASDDAVALMMAIHHAAFNVDAVTIVAGNVPMHQASINARFVIETMNADIPVYEGCDTPWLRPLEIADWYHGKDGMGEQYYPPPATTAQSEHAVNELIRRFKESKGEIILVTLGPLTNLATALALEPKLPDWVKHCYVMGGAANIEGNVTPAAEYNIWVDPEAAQKVLQSGLPLTLLGWELSRGAASLSDDEILDIRALNTPIARIAMDCNAHALKASREIQQEAGMALADPCAMAVVLDESIATSMGHHRVDISLDESLTRGMTVVDRLSVTGKPPNARVCFAIDNTKWKRLLKDTLRQ